MMRLKFLLALLGLGFMMSCHTKKQILISVIMEQKETVLPIMPKPFRKPLMIATKQEEDELLFRETECI